jgi:oligopeptidase B
MRSRLSRWALFLFAAMPALAAGCPRPAPPAVPQPPIAERRPHVVELHGQKRVDDYFWLRDRDDPAVLAYLEAENAYADAVLRHTESLQARLYEEIVGRIVEDDADVPLRIDDYYYYHRTEKGKQYPIHCRKRSSLEAPEEVILDENAVARGHDYFSLGAMQVSPDHGVLAYSTDTTGAEQYTLRFKDLATGKMLPEAIPNTAESLAWAADSRAAYYTTRDGANRPYRLHRHVLGTDPGDDALVYEERDEAFAVGVSRTNSRRHLLLVIESNTTSEVRFLPAGDTAGEFKIVEPRRALVQYGVEHHGERFYIVTNDGAINFKLVSAPVDSPGREHWREVEPHRPEIKLEGIEVFAGYMVLQERTNGVPTLRVRDMNTGQTHAVEFPEPAYYLGVGPNPEFDTTKLRFEYSSLVSPDSVFDYDMATRERTLLKEQPIRGGYHRDRFHSERVFATAIDGTRVPISLVHRRGLPRDGRNPLLLEAYGSYGASEDPYFSSARLSLLERGFVYAIAHVRGGGELGRPWYEEGKMLRKKNTFTDFIACAECLIAEKYTSPDRLAITGASAGGLLVGAVTNMRPDLFRAVVADVPFVDVLNTMLDASLPLTVGEYEEWGDPNVKEFYDYIAAYSPYDNVRAENYPDMLVLGSLNDTRVSYWEPAKWVARLRAQKTGDNLLVLRTNMGAGHGGASGRYDYARESALKYAFLIDRLKAEQLRP